MRRLHSVTAMLGHGPKRWSEVVALVSLSTTLFLYLHTRDLATQLSQERTQRHTEAGADLALAEDIHTGEEGETAASWRMPLSYTHTIKTLC